MVDFTTYLPTLQAFMESPVFRAWIVVAGLVGAGHYHAMASASKRAPLLIKYLALPLMSGAGIGMVWGGVTGNTAAISFYSGAAAGLMVIVNVSAWGSGAYVSAVFERAAALREQIAKDGHIFVHGLRNMAEAAHLPDTDAAPLEQPREQKERHTT